MGISGVSEVDVMDKALFQLLLNIRSLSIVLIQLI